MFYNSNLTVKHDGSLYVFLISNACHRLKAVTMGRSRTFILDICAFESVDCVAQWFKSLLFSSARVRAPARAKIFFYFFYERNPKKQNFVHTNTAVD